jgi:hypothetical protein
MSWNQFKKEMWESGKFLAEWDHGIRYKAMEIPRESIDEGEYNPSALWIIGINDGGVRVFDQLFDPCYDRMDNEQKTAFSNIVSHMPEDVAIFAEQIGIEIHSITEIKITITAQILDGNLGDGWSDTHGAAMALAEFTDKTWRADLAAIGQHDVEIHIDVQRDAAGHTMAKDILIENIEDAPLGFENEIERSLTPEGDIWENFCSSDMADQYYIED